MKPGYIICLARMGNAINASQNLRDMCETDTYRDDMPKLKEHIDRINRELEIAHTLSKALSVQIAHHLNRQPERVI